MYTLLIIDDEPLMRRGIKSLVELSGLGIKEILEASNGVEALKICGTIVPDIVLLDINMPKMDGLTFAKRLKEMNKTVKICMITGYDYFDYAIEALRAGVEEYILKPVTKKDIDEILRKLIQSIEKESVHKELKSLDISTMPSAGIVESTVELQLKKLVEEHIFESGFSLSSLADEVGFSSGYLSGVFKDSFGLAFQDYVAKIRIEKAKLLLLTTEMKNYEISQAVGYDDVNYFATRFKKIVGSTPKQYRNQVRGRDVQV